MGKLTINELSPSLIQYFKSMIKEEMASSGTSSSGTTTTKSVSYLKSSLSLPASTTSITIPSEFDFNPTEDLLMVFKNGTYLEESYDYTINSSGNTINPVSGSEWYANSDAPDCLFNFVVLKNVSKG